MKKLTAVQIGNICEPFANVGENFIFFKFYFIFREKNLNGVGITKRPC